MHETPTCRTIDALLIRLDDMAQGGQGLHLQALRELSDALAEAWEAHRGSIVRYPQPPPLPLPPLQPVNRDKLRRA